MSLVRKGDTTIVELKPEREFDPRFGWRTVRRWHGNHDEILSFSAAAAGPGVLLRVIPEEGPNATLEARVADGQDGQEQDDAATLQITWTLAGNTLEKDIFTHHKFAALGASADGIADQEFLRNYRGGDNAAGALVTTADGANFRNRILAGVEAYQFSQYVLRRTAMVPGGYSGQWATTNVNKFYPSSAALTAAEGIPATIIFAMPDGQWLKQAPQIQQLANGKFEITNEWWHADEWDDFIYAEAS